MHISVLASVLLTASTALPVWDFDAAPDNSVWVCNAHMADVKVAAGCLSGTTTSWDPIMETGGLEIPATPWQYVLLRIKTDRPGNGQLFWTGVTEGEYGGFSESKRTNFNIGESGDYQDIAIVPGWHRETVIRKLRLDLYDGTGFSIDKIEVLDWSEENVQRGSTTVWGHDDIQNLWKTLAGSRLQVSPSLSLQPEPLSWAAIEIESMKAARVEFVWLTENSLGLQSELFEVRPGRRTYNLELGGNPRWVGTILGIGANISCPEARLRSLMLSETPQGHADPVVTYLGFENGLNRSRRPCPVLVQIENRGAEKTGIGGYTLVSLSDGLSVTASEENTGHPEIGFGDMGTLRWIAEAKAAGEYTVQLSGPGIEQPLEQEVVFLPDMELAKADYVPEPRPVRPAVDVCMYYFPGWDSDAKWDCIRRTAPIRKPLLGYYDESRTECVDWQIKWAVENGISCFLVDWYWSDGSQYLTHWFEAYRKAKYRDLLKVAVMWANHNAPGTHSREDWRKVTREWIDNYFTLPGYYRVNNKPAIFLWNPEGLRKDLGSSEEVKAALEESQNMARDKGYEGIEFIAVNNHEGRGMAAVLAREGYAGITNYHEWGRAEAMAPSRGEARYEDVVATAPEVWQTKWEDCPPEMTYYPVVDTGWDSRPWHGAKSLVIGGRNAALFEELLYAARDFIAEKRLPFVVLGPGNEWGEGSYMEPANEYGFEMYEAVRSVFGTGDPKQWPGNYSPREVGLGPYDYPAAVPVSDWTFDSGKDGWAEMMNMTVGEVIDGCLAFKTLSTDPALVVSTPGLKAGDFQEIVFTMKIGHSSVSTSNAQLFWSGAGLSTSESASVSFPLTTDGEFHEYHVDLQKNPRWRGVISMFRFDPCGIAGADIAIDRIRLKESSQ